MVAARGGGATLADQGEGAERHGRRMRARAGSPDPVRRRPKAGTSPASGPSGKSVACPGPIRPVARRGGGWRGGRAATLRRPEDWVAARGESTAAAARTTRLFVGPTGVSGSGQHRHRQPRPTCPCFFTSETSHVA
uniref:Uncharacterized protein n=1 Tax=Arundo donax TaxID=35708 RepID=A0A0A9CEQ7_ARUDO